MTFLELSTLADSYPGKKRKIEECHFAWFISIFVEQKVSCIEVHGTTKPEAWSQRHINNRRH